MIFDFCLLLLVVLFNDDDDDEKDTATLKGGYDEYRKQI